MQSRDKSAILHSPFDGSQEEGYTTSNFLKDIDIDADHNNENFIMNDIGANQISLQDEEDDDPEILLEMDKLKEQILEEFLEYAIMKKHEAIDEVKADCKKTKANKETEKKRVQEVSQVFDKKRKEGSSLLQKQLNKITSEIGPNINEKLARLQDSETIKAFITDFFKEPEVQTV